jgi:hypothetical protein
VLRASIGTSSEAEFRSKAGIGSNAGAGSDIGIFWEAGIGSKAGTGYMLEFGGIILRENPQKLCILWWWIILPLLLSPFFAYFSSLVVKEISSVLLPHKVFSVCYSLH